MAGDKVGEVSRGQILQGLARTVDFIFCAIGSHCRVLSTDRRFAVFKGDFWLHQENVLDRGKKIVA